MEPPLDPPREPKVPASIELASSALRDLLKASKDLHDEGRLDRFGACMLQMVVATGEFIIEEADSNPSWRTVATPTHQHRRPK